MSEEMRILDCEPGALEALVLCTVCGEISRQRLLYPYKSAEPAYLAQPYTCPACRRT